MVQLKGDERLDYLLTEELRIIQSPSVFAFHWMPPCWQVLHVPVQKGNLVICAAATESFRFLSLRTKETSPGWRSRAAVRYGGKKH